MIPKKLTLKGIYSYIEQQTIDFSDLTKSGLFGIFGIVGSGKSTILEAISFALYGETERLNIRGDSRSYNMMNLKSSELLIDFEFYSGQDNSIFRFIVKGKRNKNNFDDVKAFERNTFVFQDNVEAESEKWMATDKTAEDIIGLNYDNFKRTIIIPQGKFKEFLELKAADRTKMLNEIFNLQRFDLAPKLSRIKQKNEMDLTALTVRMERYQNLSKDTLKQKKDQLQQLQNSEKQQQDMLNNLRLQYMELTKLKELFENLNNAEVEFKSLEQEARTIDIRNKELASFTDCRIRFAQLLDLETKLSSDIADKSRQFKQLRQQLLQRQQDREHLLEQLKQINLVYEQRESLAGYAKELETVLNIRELDKKQRQLEKKIANSNISVEQYKTDQQLIQQVIQDNQQALSQLKLETADLSELNRQKDCFVKHQELEKQLQEIKDEIKTVSDEFSQIIENFNSSLQARFVWAADLLDSNRLDNTRIPAAIKETIDSEFNSLNKNKAELMDRLNQLQAQKKLKQWADDLSEGEDCPLCGSKNHPKVLNIDNLEGEINKMIIQQENCDKELSEHINFLQRIDNNNYKLELLQKSLDSKTDDLEQKKRQLNELNSMMDSMEIKSLAAVEKAISKVEKNNKKIKAIELTLNQKTSELIQYQHNIETLVNENQKFKEQNTVLEVTIQNDVNKLKQLTLAELKDESGTSLKNQVKDINNKVNQAIDDFNKVNADLSKNQTEIDISQGQEKTLDEFLKENKQSLKKYQNKLAEQLADSDYSSLDKVKLILSKEIDEQREKQLISAFQIKFNTALNSLDKLKLKAKGKSFNKNKYLDAKTQIDNKEVETKQLTSKISVLQSELKQLELDLQSKKKCESEYRQLKKRSDNIQILSRLFKGQGFVRYISSIYLHNLAQAANERFFKMTRQQLQMEITEDNEFQIRDLLNEGKTRSIKTLSGGQMFQASLSLALALADSVQNQIKASHRLFFLDEGFGSLDNESLDIVFQALKSLKTENRIVGVISHVEKLKQEIDIHLQVNKTEQRGSFIDYSWS